MIYKQIIFVRVQDYAKKLKNKRTHFFNHLRKYYVNKLNMSFLKTNDVTNWLKKVPMQELHTIIEECLSYPQNETNLEAKNTGTTFGFDGTNESFNSVISNIGIENKALKSSELEWIILVLKNMGENFNEHRLGDFKGLLIFKNEMLVCYIKKQENSEADGNGRYIRIAYESVRKLMSDYVLIQTNYEKQTNNGKQEYSSLKFYPNMENLKFMLFGIVVGVVGYTYLHSNNID